MLMGGQFVVLWVLQVMFLAPVSMLSLWDLYVLGFAGGAVILAYLAKFSMDRAFDLKPMFPER